MKTTNSENAAVVNTQLLALVAVQAGNLNPVTLTVAGGECIVLSGASGSGKSRLLRAIADLDADVENRTCSMLLSGVNYLQYTGAEWRRRVAYLAAENQWWQDDVASHFECLPAPASMQALGLEAQLIQQPVSNLSSGERQRLALLRVLVRSLKFCCHAGRGTIAGNVS